MTPEQIEKLEQDCPILYRRGVPGDVGEGWFGIIYKLSLLLEEEMLSWSLLERLNSDLTREEYPYSLQIKEKFGGLAFYVSHGNKKFYTLIGQAENESFKTCEECGASAQRVGGGWVKTLCDPCNKKWEDEKEARRFKAVHR